LVENMRSYSYRETHRSKTDKEFFIPVLGQRRFDSLDSSNYTYSTTDIDGNVLTYPSFTEPTQVRNRAKRFNAKTEKMEETIVPEIPISYVDGNASGTFVAINNPQSLTTLSEAWEGWLNGVGLKTYSMTVTPTSAEKGISILCSVNMTRHWITSTGGVERRHLSERFEKKVHKSMTASPFINRLAVADTAQSTPLASPYTEVLSLWNLPDIENEFVGENDDTIVQRWQILMSEPYLLNSSSGFDGNSLAEMHSRLAKRCTKSRTAPPDQLEEFLVEAAKRGRGGILSSLIAGAVGAFFPGAAGVANQIASVVPF